MSEIEYFAYSDMDESPILLRRVNREAPDERFADGRWERTHLIWRWSVGRTSFVSRLTEAEARSRFPEAFNGSK